MQTGYIVKLTQKNTENGNTTTFYLGTDGYVHTDTHSIVLTPYKRYGNALNLIKRETETDEWRDIVRVSENSCIEHKRWFNTYEIIPA